MPTRPGRHRGPVSLLVHRVRELGWVPRTPTEWVTGDGQIVDVLNLEFATHHIRARLDSPRWERLAARRPDFRGAERGADEGASFRGPHAAMGSKDQAAFGRYACIFSGGTWTATRRMAAGFGGERLLRGVPGPAGDAPPQVVGMPALGQDPAVRGEGLGERGPPGPVRTPLPLGVQGPAGAGRR